MRARLRIWSSTILTIGTNSVMDDELKLEQSLVFARPEVATLQFFPSFYNRWHAPRTPQV